MANFDLKEKNKENLSPEKKMISFFEWKEEKKSQKDIKWQIGVIFLLALIVGLFLYQKNYFGTLTMLMIIFLIFFAQKSNEEISCAILKRGFRIKNELFVWQNIKSFWIFENTSELSLKIKKGIVQNISVPIRKKDIKTIRNLLLRFLPEEETHTSLSEIIIRKIGL